MGSRVRAIQVICLAVLPLVSLLPPSRTVSGALAADPRYAVIVVVDGARPDYFKLASMPNLRWLIKHGTTYSQAFAGQLPANTPPSHATIGTGLLPKHHGVEGFVWEDPRTHQMTDPTERTAVQSGELERVITQHGVPSIAARVRKAHPGARVASVSAHKCYAADAMGTAAADYILCSLIYHDRWVAQAVGTHRPPPGAINNSQWDVPIPSPNSGFGAAVQQWRVGAENAWTTRYALWAFHRTHYPRVLMVNLSETDVLGHFARNVRVISYLMRELDALLGQIITAYRQAGLFDRTDFVITADHGMSAIRARLPYSVISHAISLAGATPVYVEHDTGVLIGIREDRKARAVARNLFRLGGRLVDAVYYKTLRSGQWRYRAAAWQPGLSRTVLAAYGRLANTMAADAGADVVGVLAPRVSSRDYVINGYLWRAGHLGPQWGDQHIPLILEGPGIRRGVASIYPARLVDIAPTIEHLLGAASGGTDGVMLEDALTDPSNDGRSSQQARGKVLLPVVQALERRAG